MRHERARSRKSEEGDLNARIPSPNAVAASRDPAEREERGTEGRLQRERRPSRSTQSGKTKAKVENVRGTPAQLEVAGCSVEG